MPTCNRSLHGRRIEIGGRPLAGLLCSPRDWKNDGESVVGVRDVGEIGPLSGSLGIEGSGTRRRESTHVGGLLSCSPRAIVHEPGLGALMEGWLTNDQGADAPGVWLAMANVSFHIRPGRKLVQLHNLDAVRALTSSDELQHNFLCNHHPLLEMGYNKVHRELSLLSSQLLHLNLVVR